MTKRNRPRNTEKDFGVARKEIERVYAQASELVQAEAANSPDNTSLRRTVKGLQRVGKKWKAQSFQVAVLALVKSGKSTLINALLGDQFLPSSNTPETARIVRIRHSPALSTPTLSDGDECVAEGVSNIHDRLKALNASLRKSPSSSTQDELVIDASLACLSGRSFGDQKFEVLDTPGPNEAGTDVLRTRVDRLLGEVDVIIYLLDYTKLKTEEEKDLFARLSSMRPELLARFSERLFFAVNKIDLENSRGLSPEKTRKYVADVLSSQVQGLQVSSDRVLLVSAEHGLLARLVESGRADAGVVRDFARQVFGILGQRTATLEKCQAHAGELLDASELTNLEESIISFIYSNRGRLFLQSVVDDIDRHLASFDNHLHTTSRALQIGLDDLTQHAARLEQDLVDTDRGFEEVDALASRTADEVETWVRGRFKEFRKAVETELRNSCSPDNSNKKKRGGLGQLWHGVRGLFSGSNGDDVEAATKEEAKRRIENANQAIADSLRSEFGMFWNELEQEAWERQKVLFNALNSRLVPLARRIEETVSQRLDISLKPVRLQIPAPSLDEMHEQIQGRIGGFVEQHQRTENYQDQEDYLKRKGGWCSDDEYGSRKVTRQRQVTRYTVSAQGVMDYWLQWIRERTDVSVKTARAVIKQEIGDAIEAARTEIGQYRDGYVQAVRQSLEESQSGEEERRNRLAAVVDALQGLSALQQSMVRCREFLGRPRQ